MVNYKTTLGEGYNEEKNLTEAKKYLKYLSDLEKANCLLK
jgi:hypothetical protein